MEVALVNEGDRSVGAFEGLRGDEPAQTSAENKNFVCAGHKEPRTATMDVGELVYSSRL